MGWVKGWRMNCEARFGGSDRRPFSPDNSMKPALVASAPISVDRGSSPRSPRNISPAPAASEES